MTRDRHLDAISRIIESGVKYAIGNDVIIEAVKLYAKDFRLFVEVTETEVGDIIFQLKRNEEKN